MTQTTSHLVVAIAKALGWFQCTDKEPGTENVVWKAADCNMWRFTHGSKGLKPSCCAHHKNRLRYSA